ncbi:hypothetical protein AMTR_s00203p00028810 [Amborella trichopoda]|uniref:Uncharacterized protein n=1 Tax=Amborella trichopoda TaxID=13333 RepID=W1P801_AMBTC|nr:hypothetical protein AMTR_s00203p00028810 [Amborella trichopoda]
MAMVSVSSTMCSRSDISHEDKDKYDNLDLSIVSSLLKVFDCERTVPQTDTTATSIRKAMKSANPLSIKKYLHAISDTPYTNLIQIEA